MKNAAKWCLVVGIVGLLALPSLQAQVKPNHGKAKDKVEVQGPNGEIISVGAAAAKFKVTVIVVSVVEDVMITSIEVHTVLKAGTVFLFPGNDGTAPYTGDAIVTLSGDLLTVAEVKSDVTVTINLGGVIILE